MAKNKSTVHCLRKLSSTIITMKTMNHLTFCGMVSTTGQISHNNIYGGRDRSN